MDIVKKIFPLSFSIKDTGNFVVKLLVYLLGGVIFGVLAGLAGLLFGWIPLVGPILMWAISVIGSIIGVYCLAGLIILILVFCKVIK